MAPIHAVIVPIYRNDDEKATVLEAAARVKAKLSEVDIAPERARYRDFVEVVIDDRDMRPGAKYYHWERRGVPVRIELGPRDVAKGQVVAKMRVDSEAGKGKEFVPEAELVAGFRDRLLRYQDELLRLARERRDQASVTLDSWSDLLDRFSGEKSIFAWCHWDGTRETEAKIKEETQVTIRCIPLPGQGPAEEAGTCIKSGRPSPRRVLMAKAY